MTVLSLCIATFNRGAFIGRTLDTIVDQLPPGVEIVVVDGNSQDETPRVLTQYAGRHSCIRYYRESINSGIDGDYDKAVGYATGEHCWLVADDDLLAPGAVARVLDCLEDGAIDLLVVDSEVRDATLRTVLNASRLPVTGERRYGPDDGDAFLRDAGEGLSFIGGTIIRRSLWMERDRAPYMGSLFIHMGVIFQSPRIKLAKVVAEPLVIIRLGNAMWSARSFEIWMFKWPELIWGFTGYGDDAKRSVVPREPWRDAKRLFAFRANGAYSTVELKRFFSNRDVGTWRAMLWAVALFPGRLANILSVLFLMLRGHAHGAGGYNLVGCSRYSNPVSRALVRFSAPPHGQGRDPS